MRTISSACSARADGALDEDDVVRPGGAMVRRLGELDKIEPPEDVEQVVLEVEQRQLAPVAGRHLHDPEARPGRERGTNGAASSQPLPTEGRAELGEREDRSIPAHERLARAGSGRTGRRRTPCAARASRRSARRPCPRSRRTSTVASIIRSGPQMKAVAVGAVPVRAVEQLGHDADPSQPLRVRRGRPSAPTSRSGRPSKRRELVDEQAVARGPGAVHQPDDPEPIAVREDRVDERSKRREPDTARDDDDVPIDGRRRPASRGRAGHGPRASRPGAAHTAPASRHPRRGWSAPGRRA